MSFTQYPADPTQVDTGITIELRPLVNDDPLAVPGQERTAATSHDGSQLPGSPHAGRRWCPQVPHDPAYVGRHREPEAPEPKTLTGLLLSAVGVRR